MAASYLIENVHTFYENFNNIGIIKLQTSLINNAIMCFLQLRNCLWITNTVFTSKNLRGKSQIARFW